MIEFQQLVIKNFFSFGSKQTIPLANQGIVRIEGINKDEPGADSNMAGKSSIMEALLWCLFGRTIRGLKHDAVVNRFNKSNCSVSVHFHRGDASYTARRFRRHHRHQHRLQLWQGDRLLSYRHETQTQAKLESIIGCDYQSFSNTAIFGGTKPFALLTDSEQKKVLESFLGFEKFESALQRARDQVTQAAHARQKLLLKMEHQNGKVREYRTKISTLRKSLRVFRLAEVEETDAIKKKLKRLKKPDSGPTRKQLDEVGDAVESLVSTLAKTVEQERRHRKTIKLIHASMTDKEKLLNRPCPFCGQKVGPATLRAVLKHLIAERHDAKRSWKATVSLVSELERRLKHARSRLKRVTQHRNKLSMAKATFERTRRDLRERLLKAASRDPSPFAYEIEQVSTKYSRRLSNLLVMQYEERALCQRIRDLEFWVEGFGNRGVKALVVREALPTLNHKLAEYAKEIFKGGVELQFSPSKRTKRGEERELFHLRYKARHGSSSYLGESSGGRRRIDICVLLVFSWLSRTCNVLLIDELLDSLDESGREAILHILAGLRGTVLVISHERQLKARFGKVWTVTKRHGISTVETAHAA